ncbi:pyroglutamyl-peptidase 1 [Rhynchophorus ferrugineus]|uniref:pyroglutamyl-peptidase 1 n=1 Tax=Rhynchophorus ferrugineus TaxID=354439 RepID=UPI003FCD3C09
MTNFGNILITGFGPFDCHKINASWECVSLLPNEIGGYKIIKKQIPVIYSYVEENVPKLWKEFNPKLVIHVGVSSYTNQIQIETRAHRSGYQRNDVSSVCPKNCTAGCDDGKECIETGLCPKTISKRLASLLNIETTISNNAGRYLCEFIYYTSLSIDEKRTLFVHVPPLDKPFTKEELAMALEIIVKCGIGLVNKNYENIDSSSQSIYRNGRVAAAF